MLVYMTLGLAYVANAQIYSSEVMFYLRPDGDRLWICKFEGTIAKCPTSTDQLKLNSVKSELARDPNAYIDYFKTGRIQSPLTLGYTTIEEYNYCPELSTSDKDVYKHYTHSANPVTLQPYDYHYDYIAISKDLKTLITWSQKEGGEPYRIQHCINILKEDLLPKNTIPDFLYD